MSERTIFIGDVHGCLDELDNLIQTLEVRKGDDVVMLGDLVDRGPDPVGVVRRVREKGWKSILGNHEEKALRWLKNESLVKSGRPNNMIPPSTERADQWKALSADDIGWLWRLPLTLQVGKWTAVHAGLESRIPLHKQSVDVLLHARFVHNDTGKYVPMDPDTMEQPPDTMFWSEAWAGPENVVYGHSVFDTVKVDETVSGIRCIGLDTGCVYGKKLSAMVVTGDEYELVSVQAARQYFSYDERRNS